MTSVKHSVIFLLFCFAFSCTSSEAPVPTPQGEAGDGLRSLALTRCLQARFAHRGWLEEQLRIQADGLTGHLDEFWPDIQFSGWIGGEAEGWERMPYWLDGLVPLAYLLDDAELKEKVRRYLDYVIEHQSEDGWLGPEKPVGPQEYKPRDPWPVFVMMKVLTQYHDATGDERVLPCLSRFVERLDQELNLRPLFDWNRMRWQDGVLSIHWLYDRTGEARLLEVADRLHQQGYDWREHFQDLPSRKRYRSGSMRAMS